MDLASDCKQKFQLGRLQLLNREVVLEGSGCQGRCNLSPDPEHSECFVSLFLRANFVARTYDRATA